MKKINRVKKYREFKEILDKRHFKRSRVFTVYFRQNEFGFERYGILITKKNGNAVVRNKIKRQIRSIIDNSTDFSNSYDIIVVVSKKYSIDEFSNNNVELTTILTSIREKK